MNKKARNTIIISIIGLAIVLITVTYAYFAANITGIESASTISLNAGIMTINYSEGDGSLMASNMYPRSEEWISKSFTLTANNSTSQLMEYEVGIQLLTNTFKGGQLSYSLLVDSNNEGTSMTPVTNKAIVGVNRFQKIGEGSFGTVTNGVQNYTLKIYFLDNGKNQNINQGASFSGKIVVREADSLVNKTNQNHNGKHCYTDDYVEGVTPTTGKEYVKTNGQYIYKYNQSYDPTNSVWIDSVEQNGWGVHVANPTSTSPINEELCTYINDLPITDMYFLFYNSQATSIDLSSFDTSNVVYMEGMFYGSVATALDLSSFDTSNTQFMSYMFSGSQATSLDLSSFDISKVLNMTGMFNNSQATTINLSSFDTSSVTSMEGMFYDSSATSLDLSSFDTSQVINMSYMFSNSQATSLDLSSFDTSSVTGMSWMFSESQAISFDLSSFDTSRVQYMRGMFAQGRATTLDLSSFDTSNVVHMPRMFADSETLTTIYVSNGFATTSLAADSNQSGSINGSYNMFYNCFNLVGGSGTTYNSSKINKEYARIDNPPDERGYFTLR